MCGMGLVSQVNETFHSLWNGMAPKSARRISASALFTLVLSKLALYETLRRQRFIVSPAMAGSLSSLRYNAKAIALE